MTIRIGNAPCSWGVEFAQDPRNPAWRQVLQDCANAGYRGIELGPIGYMPEERGLYKKMKIGEQVLYLAQLKGLSKKEALERIKFWFVKLSKVLFYCDFV